MSISICRIQAKQSEAVVQNEQSEQLSKPDENNGTSLKQGCPSFGIFESATGKSDFISLIIILIPSVQPETCAFPIVNLISVGNHGKVYDLNQVFPKERLIL